MNSLAKERRTKRFQSGALSLNTPKLTFKLDDNGNPEEFESYPIRDSNKLVEVGCNLVGLRLMTEVVYRRERVSAHLLIIPRFELYAA